MKQTAVEWLEQQLFNKFGKFTKGDIDKAKEMEKEQIIDAVYYGHLKRWVDSGVINSYGEQYYNETFKSE